MTLQRLRASGAPDAPGATWANGYRAGNELFLYAGHGFTNGKPDKRVGRAQVAVPDFAWKVAVVLPARSGNDLARVDAALPVQHRAEDAARQRVFGGPQGVLRVVRCDDDES